MPHSSACGHSHPPLPTPDGWSGFERSDGAFVIHPEADSSACYIASRMQEPSAGWWDVAAVEMHTGIAVSVVQIDPFTSATPESLIEAVIANGDPSCFIWDDMIAPEPARRLITAGCPSPAAAPFTLRRRAGACHQRRNRECPD